MDNEGNDGGGGGCPRSCAACHRRAGTSKHKTNKQKNEAGLFVIFCTCRALNSYVEDNEKFCMKFRLHGTPTRKQEKCSTQNQNMSVGSDVNMTAPSYFQILAQCRQFSKLHRLGPITKIFMALQGFSGSKICNTRNTVYLHMYQICSKAAHRRLSVTKIASLHEMDRVNISLQQGRHPGPRITANMATTVDGATDLAELILR